MRPNRYLPLLLLLIAVCCAGCLDVEENITLNPDGSGKVAITSDMNMPFLTMGATTPREIDEMLREYAGQIIEESEGIEVWKDVECKKLPNGHISFKGTAYFPDITLVKVNRTSLGAFTTEIGGDSMRIAMLIDPKKTLGKELGDDDASADAPAPAPAPMPETPGDSTEPMPEGSQMFQDSSMSDMMRTMGRSMLGMMFKDLRFRTVLNLPGQISSSSGFVAETGNRVSFEFPGKEFKATLDSILADDKAWEKFGSGDSSAAASAPNPLSGLNAGQPEVTVRGTGKPLFNYKSEVAAAQKKYPALLKKFKAKKKRDGEYS